MHPIAIRLCANNDVNGNPQRVFVVIDETGSIIDTIDEGYSGDAEVKTTLYSGEYVVGNIESFDTSVFQYKRMVRYGETLRKIKEANSGQVK